MAQTSIHSHRVSLTGIWPVGSKACLSNQTDSIAIDGAVMHEVFTALLQTTHAGLLACCETTSAHKD
jgi:hypothetical protein